MWPCALCTYFLPTPRLPPSLFQSHSQLETSLLVLTQLWEIDLCISILCMGEVGGKESGVFIQVTREDRQGVTQFSLSAKNTLGQLRYVAWSSLYVLVLNYALNSITHIDSVFTHFRHKRGSMVSNLAVQWVILQSLMIRTHPPDCSHHQSMKIRFSIQRQGCPTSHTSVEKQRYRRGTRESKRCHDHGKSYKRKHFIETCSLFQRLARYRVREQGGTWTDIVVEK